MASAGPERPGAAPIRVSCVEDLEALWPRAGEWNALVRANRTNTVFQTFEWQASWCRAYASSVRLLVLLAETDDELVGIAPLMLWERPITGRRRRVVEFIGSDAADYCDFILGRADVLPLFGDWLIQAGHLWDVLNLRNIADTSPLLDFLPRFYPPRGNPVDLQTLYECPTRILGDPVQDQKLLKKKSFKRKENYFLRSGTLGFRHCASVAEAQSQLDAFFEQHVRRWEAAGFKSQFLDERNRAFYRYLVQNMLPRGEVLFSVLTWDEKPIAFHFGFEYGDRIYWILPTFDLAYSDHSPGDVLLKHCLEDAISRGVGEFDFTVGEELYKYRFANHVRHAYQARVYHHRFPYHLDRFLRGVRSRLSRVAAWVRARRK